MDDDFNPECYTCFEPLRLATELEVADHLRTCSPHYRAVLEAQGGGTWWICSRCGPGSAQCWHEIPLAEEDGELSDEDELELLEEHARLIESGERDLAEGARPPDEFRTLHSPDSMDARGDPLDPFDDPLDPSNANTEIRARRALH